MNISVNTSPEANAGCVVLKDMESQIARNKSAPYKDWGINKKKEKEV